MKLRECSVLVLFIVFNTVKPSQSSCNSSFLSVMDSQLSLYEREVPPAFPVSVGIAINLRHVSINEKESTVRFRADIFLNWTDPRLAWSSDWECNSTRLSAEQIYLPDFRVLTLGTTLGAATEPLPVHVIPQGNVTWVNRLDLNIPIAMDLRSWPNDKQTFQVVFGSAATMTDEVAPYVIPHNFNNIAATTGLWDALSASVAISTIGDEFIDRRFLAILNVSVKRVAPAHGLTSGAVLAAALCSLAAAVLLPPDARAPLCAASAFTASIWLVSCLLRLEQPATTPIIVSLMCAVCVGAALVCVGAAVMSRVSRRSGAPPAPLKRLVTVASRFCRLTPDEETSGQCESGAWAATAKLLDRLTSLLMLLGIFIIFCIYFFSLVV